MSLTGHRGAVYSEGSGQAQTSTEEASDRLALVGALAAASRARRTAALW